MRWEVIPDFVANLKVGWWVDFIVTISPGNDIIVVGVLAEIDFENHEVLLQPVGAGNQLRVKFENLREAHFSGGIVSGAVMGGTSTASVMGIPIPLLDPIPMPQGAVPAPPHLAELLHDLVETRPMTWGEILGGWLTRPFRWIHDILLSDWGPR